MSDSKDTDQNDLGDDWAAAMSEQAAMSESEAAEPNDNDDPWAAALAEQGAVEADAAADTSAEQAAAATDQVFRPLDRGADPTKARELEMIMDIPVKLKVELGRTRLTIKQLLELTRSEERRVGKECRSRRRRG